MKITLIICTFMRVQALETLLKSVETQTRVPAHILIVDGSTNNETELRFRESVIPNLHYYKVPDHHRGLTKQRNYGIARVPDNTEVVAFLDDDTILTNTYFEEIENTYTQFPDAAGVGGFITNEVSWEKVLVQKKGDVNYFYFDGYRRKEPLRFNLRRKLGLAQEEPPGFFPKFGHGRSISFLPPSGKTYPVEQLMGGVSSFKMEILDKYKFSEYFEGYGLYEDADFTLRVSKNYKLFINTAATLEHHHDSSGRPNHFVYGKMVVRNGYYVWRVAYPNPSFKNKIKWLAITILLGSVRLTNAIRGNDKKAAFKEVLGRVTGLFSLIVSKPKLS